MAPGVDSGASDDFDNTQVVIRGGTDNTKIGNVGDRLKMDAVATAANNELATFIVRGESIAIGNNKSMLSLLNGSGSGIKIKIRQIKIINVQNSAVTGVISNYEMRRFTGHSGGTVLTPHAHDTTDILNGSVTARTGATISGETVSLYRYSWSTDEWGSGAQDVESNDHAFELSIPCYVSANYSKPMILNPGEGLHMKQTTNSTVGTFDIEILFTQE